MSTCRGLRVVRTLGGIALLATGSFVLAACTKVSSRVPCCVTQAPSHAPAAEPDRSPPLDPTLAAQASDPTHAVVCPGPSADDPCDVTVAAWAPRFADLRENEVVARRCDLRMRVASERPDKGHAAAAAGIVGFELLLNMFDRAFIDEEVYGSDLESMLRNLSGGWTYDKDPFKTNQFAHAYGGSIYHGFARSAGLGFWESFGYDFAGSLLWEIAGETDPPSINDQITTPIAGSFLGEALFRSASLMLERSGGRPSVATEAGAALVSPSMGFNRWAYGNRFDAVYPSRDPAVFSWWGVGARHNVSLSDSGVLPDLNRDVGIAAVSIDYGLPGKRGYSYDRPFDYFHLEATATSDEHAIPENIMVRGTLTAREYCCGSKYSGIWGLYGSYDYFSPQVFQLSSTAVSLGTTGQLLVSDKLALQGSILAGVGFSSTGTTADERADRAYRYSVSPQAQVALRAVYGDVAMLDLTVNEYFLADSIASSRATGSENVLRAQLSLTLRIAGCHALGIGFVETRRDASFADITDSVQTVGAISLFYVHLSDKKFGVVRR